MNQRLIRSAFVATLMLATAGAPGTLLAQVHVMPRPVPSSVPVRRSTGGSVLRNSNFPQPVGLTPRGQGNLKNAIYGTVNAFNGSTITILTRAGRLRMIDATQAYANGTVSTPIFIGKFVVAEGLTRTDGVLSAARISRLTRLEQSDPDR